ncbi:hypothetical protein [Allochromatium tepidum]|nr:hypothetical protein [Allochromatium tepidum]
MLSLILGVLVGVPIKAGFSHGRRVSLVMALKVQKYNIRNQSLAMLNLVWTAQLSLAWALLAQQNQDIERKHFL